MKQSVFCLEKTPPLCYDNQEIPPETPRHRSQKKGLNCMDNMELSYRIEKAVEGNYKTQRILMRCLIVFLCLLPFALFIFFSKLSWVIFLIVPVWIGLMLKGVGPLLFSFVQIQYQYTIKDMGTFTFYIIRGSHKPKLIFQSKIKDWKKIAPFAPEVREAVLKTPVVYDALPSQTTFKEDAYYALFTDENGQECAVLFEAPEKTVKACKFYNSQNTVTAG